ncbi:hypothetical protein AAE478_007359 [Parahypoxylon ruwenzoriense]
MSINPSDVYTGLWIDRSKSNSILGSKITLSSDVAILLTSFLAIYMSLAAAYLWHLIVYVIHHIRQRVTRGKCRLILQQQQVILRAGLLSGSTAFRLANLFWANRSTPSSLLSSWPLILLSLLYTIASIAAGLYSSKIIDSSFQIEVLVNSPNCGYVNPNTLGASADITVAVDRYYLDAVSIATAYSRRCYNTTDPQHCSPFVKSTINWTTDWHARCPFHESMCIGPAMQIDTGLINSNIDLGLNSASKDQINIRKITTCAPITQENYTTIVKYTNATPANASSAYALAFIPGDEMVMNTYGPSSAGLGRNFTWGMSRLQAHYHGGVYPNISSFLPIPELDTSAGDETLFFISNNGLRFVEPCDDPIFSAHVPFWDPLDNAKCYLEDRLTGVLGCLEQYQWCDSDSRCSAIGGVNDAKDHVPSISPTAFQNATIRMLQHILRDIASLPSTAALPNSNLVADLYANLPNQLPLPSNQWQIEVQAWHATVMTLLQQGILQWVVGASSPTLHQYINRPTTPEHVALCGRQRIRPGTGGRFANVSTVGLFSVLASGTLIILTSLFLDNLADCVSRLSDTVRVKQRVWALDDVLHLQRLAYEAQAQARVEAGHDPEYVWTGTDSNIPRVEGDALLGPLVGPNIEEIALEPLINR